MTKYGIWYEKSVLGKCAASVSVSISIHQLSTDNASKQWKDSTSVISPSFLVLSRKPSKWLAAAIEIRNSLRHIPDQIG